MMALAESPIQLVPDGTLLLHVVLVVAMVVVLNRTLLRPINRVLEERERRTSGKLTEAERILASVRERVGAWERGLREARTEAYRRLENERSEALRERANLIASLKNDLANSVAKERAEIGRQKEQARAALDLEAKRLAELIRAQILGKAAAGES